MPESTFSLTKRELKGEVARYLGYGGGGGKDSRTATLDAEQLKDVEQAVSSGLRQFYWPPPVGGAAHEWSWLRPTTTLTTEADQDDYDLPASFGGIEGDLTFSTDDDGYHSVKVTSEERIRELRQVVTDYSGYPTEAAVRPKDANGGDGTRWELMLWPCPDQAYTLSYRYNALPDNLSDEDSIPLGGAQYAEIVLQSCLASAERRYDEHESGYHQQKYHELLMAAIEHDRKSQTPNRLGYNGDWSDSTVRTRHPGYTGVDSYTNANGTTFDF